MLEYAKQYAQKIQQIFSKIVSTIKNIFSSSVNIFKKLFDFNTDDALDAILVVEDKILTFFVETLPKMPSFLKSVVQSVKTLLKSLKNVIKKVLFITVRANTTVKISIVKATAYKNYHTLQ